MRPADTDDPDVVAAWITKDLLRSDRVFLDVTGLPRVIVWRVASMVANTARQPVPILTAAGDEHGFIYLPTRIFDVLKDRVVPALIEDWSSERHGRVCCLFGPVGSVGAQANALHRALVGGC